MLPYQQFNLDSLLPKIHDYLQSKAIKIVFNQILTSSIFYWPYEVYLLENCPSEGIWQIHLTINVIAGVCLNRIEVNV